MNQRQILSEHRTTKVIEVWRRYIQELRGYKRNSLVMLEMCKELEIVHCLKLTPPELRAVIKTLKKKFRSEKKNIGLRSGSLSDWVHYNKISAFFVPRQRLYRPYLKFKGQQRKGRSSAFNLLELTTQEATGFRKFCAETLQLMAQSYFVARSQLDNNNILSAGILR